MADIEGFGLSPFRSFRSQVLVGPLTKVNLFAGKNNSGKSNILRFAQTILGAIQGRGTGQASLPRLLGHDIPVGELEAGSGLALGINADRATELVLGSHPDLRRSDADELRRILYSPALRLSGDELVWIQYELTTERRREAHLLVSESQLQQILEQVPSARAALANVSMRITQQSGGSPTADLRRVLGATLDLLPLVPQVQTIEAFRQIAPGDGLSGYSGQGLRVELARLQDPDASARHDRKRFDAINRFVQHVLDDPNASLRIPHHRETINVDLHGVLLPLENLGSGVHQVVILAAAATLLEGHLVCVEEPEIHLHPILQRKLIQYLLAETTNQYLIATHSAHLLDTSVSSVFHVTQGTAGTAVRRVSSPSDLSVICMDLGYRASDLVQANSVIWVEGPSDRLYLRHWLALADPSLIEGVHYSIMFYGGRLLSHLSANDPDVDDFVSLRRLNRNVCLLMDSDKHSARARLNATKQRVRREFDRGPGFAWVTNGFAIENYVPPKLLGDAFSSAHASAALRWAGEPWLNPLGPSQLTGGPTHPDKVRIAREVVSRWSPDVEGNRGLAAAVRRVVRFIQVANGMQS